MDADLQNLVFCLAMWAVPLSAMGLSSYIERRAVGRSKVRGGEPEQADGAPGSGDERRVIVIAAAG